MLDLLKLKMLLNCPNRSWRKVGDLFTPSVDCKDAHYSSYTGTYGCIIDIRIICGIVVFPNQNNSQVQVPKLSTMCGLTCMHVNTPMHVKTVVCRFGVLFFFFMYLIFSAQNGQEAKDKEGFNGD